MDNFSFEISGLGFRVSYGALGVWGGALTGLSPQGLKRPKVGLGLAFRGEDVLLKHPCTPTRPSLQSNR